MKSQLKLTTAALATAVAVNGESLRANAIARNLEEVSFVSP